MDMREPVRDVMRRTMFNLRFIEDQAAKGGPYEVTQLVNSFLGALAHPWEKLKRELRSISVAEAESQGWPRVPKERPSDLQPRRLGDLLRLMRNGIAHGNIVFLSGPENEIGAVQIWNIDPVTGDRTWGTVVTIELMRELLDRFVELAEQLYERREDTEERRA